MSTDDGGPSQATTDDTQPGQQDQQRSKNSRGGGGRGRGRGRGRGGRGRGGGGSGSGGGNANNNDRNNNSNNDRNNGGGRGRGGGGRSSGEDSNFAGRGPKNFGGRGPKHFGGEETRPGRVVPRQPDLVSDDEDTDDEDELMDADEPEVLLDANGQPTAAGTAIVKRRRKHEYCLVCYSSTLPLHRAIAPCGHDDICAQCHLRLRHLDGERRCPVCKTSNECLIVDADREDVVEVDADDGSCVHHRRFDQYEMWGNHLGNGYVYREDVNMHFPKAYHEDLVVPLFGHACGLTGCEFTNDRDSYISEKEAANRGGENDVKRKQPPQGQHRENKKRLAGMDALKAHLRIDHGMQLCDLCVDNKRDFVSKLPRFTKEGLKSHESKGDGDQSGFTGHPRCDFCNKRFYDVVQLHDHLNKEHYKCHICEKQGRPNQFFKDYDQLNHHFDRDHFLCHDAQCLAARFVVFENEIDLRVHERSVHGMSSNEGTKIKLEFRVRRDGDEHLHQVAPTGDDFQYGLNGEAFVPDALPGEERQENEPEISDPVHAARTAELRALAAQSRTRGERVVVVEAFPALGMDSSAASAGPLVGWTANGQASVARGRLRKNPVGVATQEDFPSLGGGSKSNVRSKMLRGGTGGRPAMAAYTPAALSRGSAASVASRPTMADLSGSTSFTSSYASAAPTQSRPPDMSAGSFPSLGGPRVVRGGGKVAAPKGRANPYAAAQALGKRLNTNGAGDFPSLGGIAAAGGASRSAAPAPFASASRAATHTPSRPPNFGAGNFPTLGGGGGGGAIRIKSGVAAPPKSRANPYGAAQALGKRLSNAEDDFPSFGGGVAASGGVNRSSAAAAPFAAARAAPLPSRPPSMGAGNFPGLEGGGGGEVGGGAVKRGKGKMPAANPYAAAQALGRKLAVADAEEGKATVDSIKERLGSARYKELKALTKNFAMDTIGPEMYVDQAAGIFDRGIKDDAFRDCVPDLIRAVPNEAGSKMALCYLENLRLLHGLQSFEIGGGGAAMKPSRNTGGKPINYVLPAKKKGNSWKGGGDTGEKKAVAAAKQSLVGPSEVSLAAANEAPQNGTATKFMAAESMKEERRQNQAGGGKKGKSKKKNNELKSLAFGS